MMLRAASAWVSLNPGTIQPWIASPLWTRVVRKASKTWH